MEEGVPKQSGNDDRASMLKEQANTTQKARPKQRENTDRTAMLRKRADAVQTIKKKEDYAKVLEAREQGRDGLPTTPDATDTETSKRRWEYDLHV